MPSSPNNKTRYERAKEDKGSVPLFMTSERHIFGPNGLHLVKGLRGMWEEVVDEEDMAEERARFLSQDFFRYGENGVPLSNITRDPRIKEGLEREAAKLLGEDPHPPGKE